MDMQDIVEKGQSDFATDFREDVIQGLGAKQKTIPSKYLYDAAGSALFDQITDLPEYYLTRVEIDLLRQYAVEMADAIGVGTNLIELGSGSGVKTELLLSACDLDCYIPVDIAQEFLFESSKRIQAKFPELRVEPSWSDFTDGSILNDATTLNDSRRVVFFSGSTIGNFTARESDALLKQIALSVGEDGGLLIGIDLHKDKDVLERAYNDSQGVTAKFTLNLLTRLQNELDANLEVDQFDHVAWYNDNDRRIEIYIESKRQQTIEIENQTFHLEAGERIRTEYSHKYEIKTFVERVAKHDMELRQHWTDEHERFALLFFEKSAPN